MPVILTVMFQVQRAIVRHRMEEALEKKQLVTITLKTDEVRWHKKGKEIIINGEFFDIKSFTISGTTINFTGLYDKQEKQLHKKLDETFGKKTHNKSILVAKLLLSVFEDEHYVYLFNARKNLSSHNFFHSFHYSNHRADIITPPPQNFI